MELVPPPLRKALVPVGRLDYLTEGLLLLTDDGELAQRVAHPRYGCTKTYEVKVKGRPSDAEIAKLEAGVYLEGKRTSPSRITPKAVPRRHEEMENSWWYVELTEGRTRQIREMFHRIGHSVQKLRRIAIGPVSDPDLPVGALRDLTEKEVEALRRTARKPEPKPRVRKARTAAAEPGEEAVAKAERPKPARRPAAAKVGERGGGTRTGRRPTAPPGPSRSAAGGRARAGAAPSPGAGRAASAGRSAGASRTAGGRPAGRGKPAGAGPRGAGPGKRGGPGGGRTGGRPGGGPRRGRG